MALSKLSGDEAGMVLAQLCNTFKPRDAVAFSSVSRDLRASTQAPLQQLKADHEAAAAHLCLKVGMRRRSTDEGGPQSRRRSARSCKELREAKEIYSHDKGLTAADLALLGTLGSVLPALEKLVLHEPAAGPDGVQRLAEGLGAGALPAVTEIYLVSLHVGDAGASALAAALGRGALPRLKGLFLNSVAIGDAGLVALAPALRRLPALEELYLPDNPFGDEGLTALVAPPPPAAGAPPPPRGVLTKLKMLNLGRTQVADAGCAALAAALVSGALPVLEDLYLGGTPASAAAMASVQEALARSRHECRRSRYLLTRFVSWLV
eukprot:scaffold55232_cov63-Phaeocystis_antarctica.AAC.2